MKNFLKAIVAILAVFGAAVGVLAIIDRVKNKNRIKGDYLECDATDFEEVE